MKTIRETHKGAGAGGRRVSHLEAEGAHLTVAQIQQFLDVAPDDALVSVGYEYSDRLGCVGKSRVSVEWIEGTKP